MEDQEEEKKLKSEALSVDINNEVFLGDLPCKYGTQLMTSQGQSILYFRVQYFSEKTHSNRKLKTMVVSKMLIY
jgi:hypothetical protein